MRIRSHLKANLVNYLALFLALSGGAYAATTAARNSVVSKSIKNGQVKRPDVGKHAVATSKLAASAVVPNAIHALDATRLGGTAAADYQQPVTGTCSDGLAIQQIFSHGEVDCGFPVEPIDLVPAAGSNNAFRAIAKSSLFVVVVCHDPGTSVDFFNNTANGATLNWLFSDGTTVNASGNSLANAAANGHQDFDFQGKRLEGQFIFAETDRIVTVKLHAFDGGTSCEVTGTAEFASS